MTKKCVHYGIALIVLLVIAGVPVYQYRKAEYFAVRGISQYFGVNQDKVLINKITLVGGPENLLSSQQVWDVTFTIKKGTRFSGPGYCELEKNGGKFSAPLFLSATN